jgi:hydrogenase maturation protease
VTAGTAGTVLVAGIGNIFRSDDGFGVEVARALAGRALPAGVQVCDVGIRGLHLAYQLLDGYHALLLVDATARGGRPGQLYLLEHTLSDENAPDFAVPDAHDMGPDTVLGLLGPLATAAGLAPAAGLRRVLVLGCEPGSVADGIGLTAPVAAAVAQAADTALRVAQELSPELSGQATPQRT